MTRRLLIAGASVLSLCFSGQALAEDKACAGKVIDTAQTGPLEITCLVTDPAVKGFEGEQKSEAAAILSAIETLEAQEPRAAVTFVEAMQSGAEVPYASSVSNILMIARKPDDMTVETSKIAADVLISIEHVQKPVATEFLLKEGSPLISAHEIEQIAQSVSFAGQPGEVTLFEDNQAASQQMDENGLFPALEF